MSSPNSPKHGPTSARLKIEANFLSFSFFFILYNFLLLIWYKKLIFPHTLLPAAFFSGFKYEIKAASVNPPNFKFLSVLIIIKIPPDLSSHN